MSRILCEIFVRNLFGISRYLHGYTLGCALLTCTMPKEVAEVLKWGVSSFVVLLRHSMGCRQECWWMHQESAPGSNSNRLLSRE